MQPGEMIWFLVGIGTGLALAMLGFALMAVVDSRRLARPQVQGDGEPAPRRVVLPTLDDPLPDVPPEPIPAVRRKAGAARLKRDEAPEGSLDEMMSSLAAELERMQSSESTKVTVELPEMVAPMTAVAEPMVVVVDDAAAAIPGRADPAAAVPLTPMRAAMTKAMESRRAAARETSPLEPLAAAPMAAEAPQKTEVVRGPVPQPKTVPDGLAAPPAAARPAISPPASLTPVMRPAVPVTTNGASDGSGDEAIVPAKPKVPPLPRVAPARKFAPALPPRQPPAGSKPN